MVNKSITYKKRGKGTKKDNLKKTVKVKLTQEQKEKKIQKDLELLERKIDKLKKPITKKKRDIEELQNLKKLFESKIENETSDEHESRIKKRRKRKVNFEQISNFLEHNKNRENLDNFLKKYKNNRISVSGLEKKMTTDLQKKLNSEIEPLKEKIRPQLSVLTKEKYKLQNKLKTSQSRRNNQSRQNNNLQKTQKK